MASKKSALPTDTFDTEIVPADLDAAMTAAGVVARGGILFADPKNLYVLPNYNMRVEGARYKNRVEYLRKLMAENGYDRTEPITVFAALVDGEPKLVVQDGHRRRDASLLAKIEEVSIVTMASETSATDLQYALILKNSGEPPAPYEAAVVAKRLINLGESKQDIAKRLQVTRRYVEDLLVLADAPSQVIEAVNNEQMSATLAIENLRTYDADQVVDLLMKTLRAAASEGKTKITKKSMENVATKKGGKSKAPTKGRVSRAEAEEDVTDAVTDFLGAFDDIYSNNDAASYEIAFDSKTGHVATLLDGPSDSDESKEIAQGVGATMLHACAAAVKDYTAKKIAAAAEDL